MIGKKRPRVGPSIMIYLEAAMAARGRKDSVWGAIPDTIWGCQAMKDSTWGLIADVDSS